VAGPLKFSLTVSVGVGVKAWCGASATVGTVIVTFTDRRYTVCVASETMLQKVPQGYNAE